MNHEPDSTLAVTKTCPKDGVHLSHRVSNKVSKITSRHLVPLDRAFPAHALVHNPSAATGPGDTRFLKLFRPIDRGRFIMIGSGHNLYHLVYVNDLCRGMIRAAESPRAVGRAYILAGPSAIPIRELVGLIARVLSVPIPRWSVPFGPVYLASWICELGWKVLPGDPPLYRRRVDFFRRMRSSCREKMPQHSPERSRVCSTTRACAVVYQPQPG